MKKTERQNDGVDFRLVNSNQLVNIANSALDDRNALDHFNVVMRQAKYKTLQERYSIPLDAKEITKQVKGYIIGYSELAMHTGHAGKKIKRLWKHKQYGYAIVEDNSFLHGSLCIHVDNWVSLS